MKDGINRVADGEAGVLKLLPEARTKRLADIKERAAAASRYQSSDRAFHETQIAHFWQDVAIELAALLMQRDFVSTGIVRRVDDLGRVVISKDLRRKLGLKEGDPIEFYESRDGQIAFRKYIVEDPA